MVACLIKYNSRLNLPSIDLTCLIFLKMNLSIFDNIIYIFKHIFTKFIVKMNKKSPKLKQCGLFCRLSKIRIK